VACYIPYKGYLETAEVAAVLKPPEESAVQGGGVLIGIPGRGVAAVLEPPEQSAMQVSGVLLGISGSGR